MGARRTPEETPAKAPAKRKPRAAVRPSDPPAEVPLDLEAASAVSEASADAVPLIGSGRMVVFYLEGQRYAFPIDRVQEIQQIVAYTGVPDPSGVVLGMVTLRGSVVPLLDLRSLVGLPRRDFTLETPMIICRHSGSLVAIVVDEVEDVSALPPGSLQAPSKLHSLADRMLGVCRTEGGLVFLLDLARLLPAEFVAAASPGTEGGL